MKRRREKRDNAGTLDTSAADADVEYFLTAMTGVVRLAQDPRGHVPVAPPIRPPRAASSAPSPTARETIEHSEAGFAAPGVDRRELRKLKRGDYPAGRRLDLHGMTAAEAVAGVMRFIDDGHRRHRCVCIIHGRGLHSEANVSILKTRVRAYLRTHRAVLAYADAPRGDGGDGAVYVLLRK
ncbi:MAG: Smr/MutS family protein [Acidobacteriota bacterium]